MLVKVVSLFAVVITTLGTSACNSARPATQSPASVSQARVRLRCEQQLLILECRAFADEATAIENSDITERVRWTSDTRAVIVDGGRIRSQEGGAATVTATMGDVSGSPSASVMVVADARSGQARRAYVMQGEVRRFPSAEGIGGASVSLISEGGAAQSVTTSTHGDGQGHFRFTAVTGGTYHLRAVHDGYRATELRVVVPDDMPRTITLLPEPQLNGN
jgi:hypothetical protein